MKKRIILFIVVIVLNSLMIPTVAVAEDGAAGTVSEEFIMEKLDEAVEILNDEENSELYVLEAGENYKKEEYDLGDGALLIVEMEDRADEGSSSTWAATSGSSTLWKEYGNRYFTATATIVTDADTVFLKLRNYYTLSENGIDIRKGVSYKDEGTTGSVTITKGTPVITDSLARTEGASDVNMYCNFTVKNQTASVLVSTKYKMTSTVGYVEHDYDNDKIKVKQSWNISKV